MIDMLEEKLGFDKIREYVASECTNTLALRMVHEMTFQTDYLKIKRDLDQTDEFRRILLGTESFPAQDFLDLTDELTRIKVGNTVIEQQALFDLKCSLATITSCVRFFQSDVNNEYPELKELASHVRLDPSILKTINKIIDDKGEIFDNASELLADIRHQIHRKRSDVDAQLSRSLARAKQEGWAPDNADVTIRNGRMVIPMLDTHRRKMKGLIHDESATRQTAYLEPSEVVELNNDLRELEFAERREIQKILLKVSDMLRPQLLDLVNAYWVLARLDFIRAKASFALRLNAGLPIIDNETKINWLDARHPLLYINYLHGRSDNRPKEVVPFSINLDTYSRILIISGPNAGGKSVCLKAIGLIQYMIQCGLLVPCRETSEFGVFSRIFIDIGDQQSIDDDLSTYSSHLQNMKTLVSEADPQTLFLLDELGGGTEPRSGCAIAEALLEELYQRHSFGVVTTHFADLKLLADRYPAICNGAMLFDTEKMRPRYMLSVGHPGSSFAFEIAANIGFPKHIIEAAGKKLGGEMLNFEHQLQQLELDKQDVSQQKEQLAMADAFLAEVTEKYQNLTAKLEAKKYEILSQARSQAKQILLDANRTVEQTISDIKSAQADRERTIQARAKIKEQEQRIDSDQQQHDSHINDIKAKSPKSPSSKAASPVSETDASDLPVTVGCVVRIDGGETYGQVVEIKGKKAVVESNSLRMTIPVSRLQATRKQRIPVDKSKTQSNRFQSIFNDINEKRKTFNPTLDVRGMRAEEALELLQRFLDDARLLSEREIRILHGKGYGILKQVLREYLRNNRDVKNIRSEQLQLGGDGITVVTLA